MTVLLIARCDNALKNTFSENKIIFNKLDHLYTKYVNNKTCTQICCVFYTHINVQHVSACNNNF